MPAELSGVLVEGVDARSGPGPHAAIELEPWIGFARRVLEGLELGRPAEMGLRFVEPEEMAELNDRHMGQPGPTDVLSFPVDGDPRVRDPSVPTEPGPVVLGDVVVCPTVAAAGAEEHGIGPDEELALLIVHGILHLLGWDHRTPAEVAAMRAEERRLLANHRVGAP